MLWSQLGADNVKGICQGIVHFKLFPKTMSKFLITPSWELSCKQYSKIMHTKSLIQFYFLDNVCSNIVLKSSVMKLVTFIYMFVEIFQGTNAKAEK